MELCICQTAKEKFEAIVKIVGGDRERVRAKEMLARLRLVPDSPSPRSLAITLSPKMKEQHRVIFGTCSLSLPLFCPSFSSSLSSAPASPPCPL